jgi:hypothetical protein
MLELVQVHRFFDVEVEDHLVQQVIAFNPDIL